MFIKPRYLIGLLVIGGFFTFSVTRVAAKSFYYKSYDVQIDVNKDSTMEVTEKLAYVFDGTFTAVTRGIQLDNPSVRQACEDNDGLTCGGFEYMVVEQVKGNGKVLSPSEYTTGIQTNDDESKFYIVDWEFAPDGRTFDGRTEFDFEVKYKVYGGVQYRGANPYLYWNAISTDKGGTVQKSTVTINLPEEKASEDNLKVYGTFRYTSDVSGSRVILTTASLSAVSDFTISYEMSPNAIIKPAQVRVSGNPIGQKLYIDGAQVDNTDFTLNYFPAGDHKFKGEFPGYITKEISANIKPGESRVIDLRLDPEPVTQLLIYANYLLLCCGCLLIPVALLVVYQRWQRKGRDQQKIETVIPLFSPPKDLRPYLVGSLIDEQVDRRDLSGTIIDLAYRGYIKIKELTQGSNYQLTRLAGKEGESLTAVEQNLLDAIFSSNDEVETKDMSSRFALKYPGIVNQVYREMVTAGFFTSSPQETRAKYMGCGIGIFALGVVTIISLITAVITILGQIGPFTIGIALCTLGIGLVIAAKFMPAKTTLGSKVYNEILGFKMYLETAEKYTLQNLTPEQFEKYLSYAIVFGIEQKWADKFKDIYKQQPDWYESNNPDFFTTYWLTRSLRSFTSNMETSVFTPASTGGHGSGWSGGGGSFGGFSGGGGGGGFSGAR